MTFRKDSKKSKKAEEHRKLDNYHEGGGKEVEQLATGEVKHPYGFQMKDNQINYADFISEPSEQSSDGDGDCNSSHSDHCNRNYDHKTID